MKPIEPGCLAILTKSSRGLEGRVVTVLRRVEERGYILEPNGAMHKPEDAVWWAIDIGEHCSTGDWMAMEKNLLRIDGGESDLVDIREDLVVTA